VVITIDNDSGRALRAVRAAAAVTAIGAVTSPPLGALGSAAMLIAFAFVPQAGARLARVLREPLGRGWLLLVAALLFAAAVGAVLASPESAARGLLDWRQLLLVPLALAAFDTNASRARFALALVAIAVLGALVSLVAMQVGYSRNQAFPGIVMRNPVTQALAFAVGALLAAVLAATQDGWSRRQRMALAALALLLAAHLVFLQTGRSGFLALLVAGGVSALLLVRGRVRLIAVVAAPLLAAVAVAASPNLQQRFGMALTELREGAHAAEYSSMGARVVIWQTSVAIAGERPLLGVGLGGFARAYEERIRLTHREGWQSLPVADPHNQFLFVWAEAGVAGLAGFLAFLFGAVRQRAGGPFGAVGLGLLAAWCVNSLFSSHFQTFNEGHLIAVMLGVFLARTPAAEEVAPAGGTRAFA
jgi:O-antigen ligase